jgi:hypothetical protein
LHIRPAAYISTFRSARDWASVSCTERRASMKAWLARRVVSAVVRVSSKVRLT